MLANSGNTRVTSAVADRRLQQLYGSTSTTTQLEVASLPITVAVWPHQLWYVHWQQLPGPTSDGMSTGSKVPVAAALSLPELEPDLQCFNPHHNSMTLKRKVN